MSSAVVSTSAAQSRLFIFDGESAPGVSSASSVDVETAILGCPVEQSSTATHEAHQPPGLARHDSRGRLLSHEHPQSAITHQKFPPSIISASRLAIRPAPEMVPSGITALDALTGGLPRGCITEICGSASSGRMSVLLAALAAATRRGECCALIDATDSLHPRSVAAAGIDLNRLLWVRCGPSLCRSGRIRPPRDPKCSEGVRADIHENHRTAEKNGNETNHGCPTLLSRFVRKRVGNDSANTGKSEIRSSEHRLEQVLRATDLLLESGGFGLIALDLADIPAESARRIPLTTWFRFRRSIEHTPTILLVIEPQPIAGSCSSLLLQLGVPRTQYPVSSSKPSHSHLFTGLEITVEMIHSRHDRKPAHSVAFETRTAWAG